LVLDGHHHHHLVWSWRSDRILDWFWR